MAVGSIVGIIVAAVAATVTTAVEVYQTESGEQEAAKAENKAIGLANQKRLDALRKDKTDESLARQKLQLERAGLGLNAMQADKAYKFDVQKWNEQKGIAERQEKRQATQTALSNLMGYVNSDAQLKNNIVQRYGA
jgi:hypothetical protein